MSNEKITAEDINAFAAAYQKVRHAIKQKSYIVFIENAIRSLRKNLPISDNKK